MEKIKSNWHHTSTLRQARRLDIQRKVCISGMNMKYKFFCPITILILSSRVYFFGGFGPAPEHALLIPFLFASSADDAQVRGWNNQLLCYDPDSNEWTWPHTRGTTPSPRAAHAADISDNMLYVFGGRLRDARMSSLHCLNMDTMEWSPK